MERIILFRFHKELGVCRNHIELLKRFNPGIRIFALGEEKIYDESVRELGDLLENIYCVKGKSAEWKWRNGDLEVRQWFIDYGHRIKFDMLHLVEWDLLLFDSLDVVYKKIPKDAIGLSGLIPLKNVEKRWAWTAKESYRRNWIKFLKMIKRKFGYDKIPYACIGPGYCLSRKFLEKYSKLDVPVIVHDELRLPAFAQILGIKMYDTGFYEKWYGKKAAETFNSIPVRIRLSTIKRELAKKNGKRVFHPYYKSIGNLKIYK